MKALVLVPLAIAALVAGKGKSSTLDLRDGSKPGGGGDGDGEEPPKRFYRRIQIKCGLCGTMSRAMVSYTTISPLPTATWLRMPPGWSMMLPMHDDPRSYVSGSQYNLACRCPKCFEWPGGGWAPVPTKDTDDPSFLDWVAKEARRLLRREWERLQNGGEPREPLPWEQPFPWEGDGLDEKPDPKLGFKLDPHQRSALGRIGMADGARHAAALESGKTPPGDDRALNCNCEYCYSFAMAAPRALPPGVGTTDNMDEEDDDE